jgi:cytochrome c peroxidase
MSFSPRRALPPRTAVEHLAQRPGWRGWAAGLPSQLMLSTCLAILTACGGGGGAATGADGTLQTPTGVAGSTNAGAADAGLASANAAATAADATATADASAASDAAGAAAALAIRPGQPLPPRMQPPVPAPGPGPTPAPAPAPAPAPGPAPAPTPPAGTPTDAARLAIGDKLFHEPRLSAGGNLACATCHVKERGHADAEGVFLPVGGVRGDQQGLRSTPSNNYLDDNTAFRFDAQRRPVGGFAWDGRENDRVAQALGPLLAANEMANSNSAEVVARVRALPYFAELSIAYGLPARASDAQVLQATQRALADYQALDTDYHLYTSKFDAVQGRTATFTAQEARGLAVFNDPRRGNCADCHTSTRQPGQAGALFTNFRYFAIGVPRNRSVATANPAFFDMGLCGPLRTDLASRTDLCGFFKVPTLRNVALTAPYFHNGVMATLEEVVAFYATRDTEASRWYPTVGGVVQAYNDLPPALRGNVTQQAPFDVRPGQPARLTQQDQLDLVAFLRTLTDGYVPAR